MTSSSSARSTSRPSRGCGPPSSSTCAPAQSSARIAARTARPGRSSCSTRRSRPHRRRCPSSSERPTRRWSRRCEPRGRPSSCVSRSGWTWTSSTAEAAVEQAHPEVEWLAGRPIPTSLEQARALRAELWEARRAVYAAAAEAVEAQVTALGGTVAYVSTSAPLVFVDLPSDGVAALAERPEVLSLGLEQGWRTFMSSAGVTVGANWTGGSGDQGNGVRVAVVEYANASNTGDLAGQVVKRYSTNGTDRDPHPSDLGRGRGRQPELYVAGRCAGRRHRERRHRELRARAVDRPGRHRRHRLGDLAGRRRRRHRQHQLRPGHRHWRRGGSTLLRLRRLGGQPAGRRVERQLLDLRELERRLSRDRLQRAHGGRRQRPQHRRHRRRHPLVSDRTARATVDPDGTAWNPHGDYNKPNLSAPAVSVRTANGTIGDGTSISSPIVAGIGAQLIARSPTLATWPEATRAILMAGAIRRTPLPGGGLSRDHEGVGTASARWSNRVLDNGVYGGWMLGTMTEGQTVTRNIACREGPASEGGARVEQPHLGNLQLRQDRRPARRSRPGDPPAERDDDRVLLVRQLL